MISYAQHNEDILLYALLYDVKDGFYVDVGANHPTNDSVTKFFYTRGWHGINIEPISELHEKLKNSRPRDINVNVGVASSKGTLKLREYGMGRHGLSSFTKTTKAPTYLPYRDYEVAVLPLRDILKMNDIPEIDFLKIDVEGMEHEVITSNDWKKYRPKVILIEDNDTENWYKFILDQGYKEVCFDGLNRYFVPTESKRDLSKYQEILNQEVIRFPVYTQRKKIDTLGAKLQDMYEKHTELGMRWHSLLAKPEEFLTRKQLSRALLRRSRAAVKRKVLRR